METGSDRWASIAFGAVHEKIECASDLKYSTNARRRGTWCPIQDVVKQVQRGEFEITGDEIDFGPKLGEGASGSVFRARWRGKICAAKMLKHGITTDTLQYQDLITELSILTRVGPHRNLVSFYGADLSDLKSPIIVVELMEGRDLGSFLRSKPNGFRLGRLTVYHWTLDILSALDHLHDRDPIIMHRDMKPANILLSRDRKVLKVTDFGLAKTLARSDRMQMAHALNTGSLRYMAPEVLGTQPGEDPDGSDPTGAVYTERADIYSTSLIVWYLLTGMEPYIDIRVHPTDRPNTALSRARWEQLSALLESMWQQHPERRPSAGQCLQDLYTLSPSRHCCGVQ